MKKYRFHQGAYDVCDELLFLRIILININTSFLYAKDRPFVVKIQTN